MKHYSSEPREHLRTYVSGQLSAGGLQRMQWAVLFLLEHPKEIAILGDANDPARRALIDEVYQRYLPNKVVTIGTPQQAADTDAIPLLARKSLVKGKPGAYVCRNYLCGRPVNTPADLVKQLDQSR